MSNIFKQIFKYQHLLKALVVRHLAQRYRRSVLGYLWSILNPILLMLVYALVFKYYIRFDDVNNYTVFLFCGLLPWIWTQSSLIEGANSVVASGHLVTKSFFPAEILPTVAVTTNLINFLLALPILFLFMFYYQISFSLSLLYLPLIILLQFCFLLGVVWAISAVNVRFRDVQHIVANLLTFIFFLCPIIYPISSVPERFLWTFKVNPFAIITKLYQTVIINGHAPSIVDLSSFALYALFALWLGAYLFNNQKESFAEAL